MQRFNAKLINFKYLTNLRALARQFTDRAPDQTLADSCSHCQAIKMRAGQTVEWNSLDESLDKRVCAIQFGARDLEMPFRRWPEIGKFESEQPVRIGILDVHLHI